MKKFKDLTELSHFILVSEADTGDARLMQKIATGNDENAVIKVFQHDELIKIDPKEKVIRIIKRS